MQQYRNPCAVQPGGSSGYPSAAEIAEAIVSRLSGVTLVVGQPQIKGRSVYLLNAQGRNGRSTEKLDMRQFNAAHIDVFVSGATPSASVLVNGSNEAGGTYNLLPDPNAAQRAVVENLSFDVACGAAWLEVEIADISGTFGAGTGYTVLVTPYVAPVSEVAIGAVRAGKLRAGAYTYTTITCTNANTDYAAGAAAPAWANYIVVLPASNMAKVGFGAATTDAIGMPVAADSAVVIPIDRSGGGDDTVHAQSPTAGTVVYVGYLP